MRTTKMRYGWNLANLALFVVQIVADINKYDAAYFEDQKRLGRPIYYQLLLECAVFWPLQVVLAVLDWRKYLLLVFIPGLVGKWSIITVNLLQHDGCLEPDEPNGKYNFALEKAYGFVMRMIYVPCSLLASSTSLRWRGGVRRRKRSRHLTTRSLDVVMSSGLRHFVFSAFSALR